MVPWCRELVLRNCALQTERMDVPTSLWEQTNHPMDSAPRLSLLLILETEAKSREQEKQPSRGFSAQGHWALVFPLGTALDAAGRGVYQGSLCTLTRGKEPRGDSGWCAVDWLPGPQIWRWHLAFSSDFHLVQ